MKAGRKIVIEFGPDTQGSSSGGQNGVSVGHCLGVNALSNHGTRLFSGGRDGQVIAWNLDPTTQKTQASQSRRVHSDWVNGLTRIPNEVNDLVVSCSSDLTVKLWNVNEDQVSTIGQHQDYVKCVASGLANKRHIVVSGGLDRKICGWNVETGQQLFCLDAGKSVSPGGSNATNDKASIYTVAVAGGHALSTKASGSGSGNEGGSPHFHEHAETNYTNADLIASGSPDGIVRLWDSRSPRQAGQLIGHTDNIRHVYVSSDGEYVLSASSDATVRLWSVSTARVMQTFQMHDDSVWTLFSTDPELKTFYSGDRGGQVFKTQIGCGTQLVCDEHEGIFSIAAYNGHLWTATSNARIHRWKDVELDQKEKPTNLPVETLKGHTGLVKHQLLTDKRRALTLDSGGQIVMWDLMTGKPIQTFPREKDIDTLTDELCSACDYVVANWCRASVRTGALCISLDAHMCFDAEIYADELSDVDATTTTTMDQRINYGRWILSNLFRKVLDKAKHELESSASVTSTRPSVPERKPSSVNEIVVLPSAAAQAAANSAATATTPPTTSNTESEPKSKIGRFFGKLRKDSTTTTSPATTPATTPTAPAAPAAPPAPTHFDTFEQVLRHVHTSSGAQFPGTQEAPPLEFPQATRLCITEDGMDLWRGTVGDCEHEYKTLKSLLPGWVGQVLLQDRIPRRELPKVGFTVSGNNHHQTTTTRLMAYNMLRAHKICEYVSKQAQVDPHTITLYCNEQEIPHTMTLGAVRTKIWKSGGDVCFKYRVNEDVIL